MATKINKLEYDAPLEGTGDILQNNR